MSRLVLGSCLGYSNIIYVGGNFQYYKKDMDYNAIILSSSGERDTSFKAGLIGGGAMFNYLTTLLLSNGKLFSPTTLDKPVCNLDGSQDSSMDFGTYGFNSTVYKAVIQPDGKIICVGNFSTLNYVSCSRIVRINTNGTIDSSFNVGGGFNNAAYSVALQSDGKIVVVGYFTSYQSVATNYIIRLNSDGSKDTSFNIGTGFNSGCLVDGVFIQPDGKIIAPSQYMTSYNGNACTRIVRINTDGSFDSTFGMSGADFNSHVRVVVPVGDQLYIGGGFNTYKGVSSGQLIRVNSDGTRDTSLASITCNGTVQSIAFQSDGKILIGGAFTTFNGYSVNGVARLLYDGAHDTSFATAFTQTTTMNVQQVFQLPDGRVFVNGSFDSPYAVLDSRMVSIDIKGDKRTPFNIGSGFNVVPQCGLVLPDGNLVVGGNFTTYKGVTQNRLIMITPSGDKVSSFDIGTGFNNTVSVLLLLPDGKILVGGSFSSYQGVAQNYLIKLNLDGSKDTSFNIGTGLNSSVNYLINMPDDKILVVGGFTTYQGVAAKFLVKLNSDGSKDTSFDIGVSFNTTPSVAKLQADGKIIVAGSFSTFNGITEYSISRVNSDGSRDASFGSSSYSGYISDIELLPNGKILAVGQYLTSYRGVTVYRIIRINTDGTRDTSFVTPNNGINSGTSSSMKVAVQQDGKILVIGDFTTVSYLSYPRIVRLLPDGAIDTSFVVGSGLDAYASFLLILRSR